MKQSTALEILEKNKKEKWKLTLKVWICQSLAKHSKIIGILSKFALTSRWRKSNK